ncbi:YheC/YheD family protein [Evansella sp. LMS18]|uniref:YheC/YheD family protein n=1 Tax=Evansella sp. LMS18 TaxID=2924033 RepID=UPI0020D1588A|nr:YheC/YheD family protein [Evansella sp. LMS18]UTR11776.1 YheC/YheD family protein [Evansella sp. LMS18]
MDDKHNGESKQIINILDTVIELIDVTIREGESGKPLPSLLINLESIVHGLSHLTKFFNSNQSFQDATSFIDVINNNILLFVKCVEAQKYIESRSIFQFKIKPKINELKNEINMRISEDLKDKTKLVGVYIDRENPIKVANMNRIRAIHEEGKKLGVTVTYFSAENVDFEQEKIIGGKVLEGNKILNRDFHFPDVIYNLYPVEYFNQSYIERELRRRIPFTSVSVGGKYTLPEKFVKGGKTTQYFIPFKVIINKSDLYNFIDMKQKVVLKPIKGNQGERVYYIEKKRDKYILKEHKKSKIYTYVDFDTFIDSLNLKDNIFISQEFIPCYTKQKEPFDIRAHYQKNKNGEWELTKIYPRIGNKDSILSNISKGGRTGDLIDFLKSEYGADAKRIEQDLLQIAEKMTLETDELYGHAVDELGLDIAIDENKRYWIFEINGAPGAKFHEGLRAKKALEYALYLDNNGIFYQEKNNFSSMNLFNAKQTSLEIYNSSEKMVGLMFRNHLDESDIALARACVYVAKYEGLEVFYFSPKDIDFNNKKIRGKILENRKWVEKIVNYPDGIYDRLRGKGLAYLDNLYMEFSEIPITNELYGDSESKLKIYEFIEAQNIFDKILIPFKSVTDPSDIHELIDKYNKIVLKPEIGSFAIGVQIIEKVKGGGYDIVEDGRLKKYTPKELNKMISERVAKGPLISQKFIKTETIEGYPFDIRVHLMKNINHEWVIVMKQPRIGFNPYVITVAKNGGYLGKYNGFLERNFGTKITKKIEKQINYFTIKLVNSLEKMYQENINEVALDIAVNRKGDIFLIEANMNRPGINYYEFEVAETVIPYIKSKMSK